MAKFALGQSLTRIEDLALLRGAGRYADDVGLPGAAHAAIVRSPHAHARIARIDTAAARRAPGVLTVLTGADVRADGLGDIPCLIPVTNLDGTERHDTPRPILAADRVRHVGDPVALVVGETAVQARDAAELVEVDYEPLGSVVDVVAAMRPGAARVWDDIPGNLAFDAGYGDAGAVDAAFRKAARVTRLELRNNRLVANPIEPRAALADYDAATGRSTLHVPSQGPSVIHEQLAGQILKLDAAKLRVLSGNVGGAFGMKIFVHPEQPLVVWASRRLKRAVRWTSDRSEAFVSDVQGRDNHSVAELAMDADGRFLALRVTTLANMGAYLSNYAPYIPYLATPVISGVYRIPAIYVNVKGVVTNTVPVDAYRGAGRPEAIYLIERVVDLAARELGVGPEDLRRRNFVRPENLPYDTGLESVYDSGDFDAVMRDAMARADWSGFAARREAAKRAGRLRGIGLAMYIERCGGGSPATVKVEVDPAGKVTLFSGMQDNGQGHVTSYVQLLSERFGLDASHIRVVQGDTDTTPPGMTGGSRFLAIAGVAAQSAADEVIAKGREIASGALEAAAADIEYRDGRFSIAGTDRGVSLFDVARLAADPARVQAGVEPGLASTHTRDPAAFTYPNGCHVCEVEIDPDTGDIRIDRYTVVDDFGRAINPLLLEGQVHGGSVQGIGQALLEHGIYDDETGQLLSGSFMDYAMPRADDAPRFDCAFHNVPCTTNPLGVKGSGEAGAVGAPPAVINAVVDALAPVTGLKHLDMPATREKIWRTLRAGTPS